MSDVQLYLLEVDQNKSEAHRIAAQSATKLGSKQLKLIDVIASLEEYINNKEDGDLRAKSVSYLADVLERLPPKILTIQERRLLCDFITSRIEGDVEGVGASARALLALEERGKWETETAQRVMRSFMDHTPPLRSFPLQTERYPIIQLIDVLLAKYRDAMKQLQESDCHFMGNFTAYFEGEKDPRNLMMVFSLMRVPMAEWDVQGNAQDMFEAVFNYFPITFKPPPDDPYGITAQDLKDRLKSCIAANSDFAPYAFPALLDKLDSTSVNTKRDVLHTIQACVSGYGANTINLYSITLWDALKFEIINLQEEDLAAEALRALALLGKKLAGADGPLNSYLRPIIKECNEHIEDAPTKQSQGAGKILHAVAKGAPQAVDRIAKGIFPVLFSIFRSSESIAKRRGLFEVYNQIVKAYLELQASGTTGRLDTLQAFANDALDAMIRALVKAPKSEVSFRLTALSGLSQLVQVRGALSEYQVTQAVDSIDNIVLHERVSGHGDISVEAIKHLIELAHTVPEVIRQHAVPAFMVELPDVALDRTAYAPVLEAFAQLSREQQVFDTVTLRIKNKFNAAKQQGAPKEYQRALLLGLLYAFTHGSPSLEDGGIRSKYFYEYAEPLLVQLRSALPSEADDFAAEIIGRIANVTLRQQTPHFQSAIYNRNLDWLPPIISSPGSERIKTYARFSLFYYAALRPEITEPSDILSLLRAQVHYLLSAHQNVVSASTVLQHLSLLINKFLEPKTMHKSLEDAGVAVEALLSGALSARKVDVAFAVAKALIVQGKCIALTSRHMSLLLETLPKAPKTFAQHFAGLLAPDDILTKENHCSVSGLYKQRTFSQTAPSLIENVRLAETADKPHYLIALSGVLQWLPYSVIEPALSSLMAPLLQSLDLKDSADQEVKYSTLTIFESLLMHNPSIASGHCASLITRLLNSTSTHANLAKVRAKALQCLLLIAKQLKPETILPYRRSVVQKLLGCLDDVKRTVRSEAVKCRGAWLALDEGIEDEE